MLGILAFLIASLASVTLFIVGRWAAGFAFASRGFADAITPWSGGSFALRASRGMGGALGWYLGATIAITLALMTSGATTIDDMSMRVTVLPGGPGARAGMRNGDRVIAIEGEPIVSWDQMKDVVAKREGQSTHVTIERDGVESVVEAVPTATAMAPRARLLISPYATKRSIGFGEAFSAGLSEPIKIVKNAFVGLIRTVLNTSELSGPVGIVNQVSSDDRFALGLKLGASLASYVWPLILLISVSFALMRRSSAKA